ncbi:MAG: FAD-binding oxidoreductase [Rhodospirillales bacterium]|jgi:sarcosine oxidase, subunit beta|nr:FAD-binding oxidoreductase [Rhodospirillales bacterium]MBT4041847.1 FAD-binding oxidoreductase [Rhodospirillales bacterium]MBT4626815.1 FAD-binding oxidoreductase [Rhodospirillales bacterium]MBT5351065.1 FAD-binding oxidoreductase [Rhodospirillales bacterium]MBT5521202.1 FAD-binding oxidoreductase [Rhodospirillales bacterium]
MTDTQNSYDAIIIGAGIIGTSVAYELCRKGYKTLSIDKLPAAGYGSTAGSCAIIRTYYSTLEGSAIAYDGINYWRNWREHLEAPTGEELAVYKNTGCVVLKTDHNKNMSHVTGLMDQLGVPYEDWSAETLKSRFPIVDTHEFYPPRRHDDPQFGTSSGRTVNGAIFFPDGGYVSDPQFSARNVQAAVERHGGAFKFNAAVQSIRQASGRVVGVTLADGTDIDAPIVVNVAGPHSAKINDMAGLTGTMKIDTRALRHEVAHVPAPAGFDYENEGFIFSDSDIACYSRPEIGNHILIGSEDPECDPQEWVDPDAYELGFTDQWTAQVSRMAQRFEGLGIPNQAKGLVSMYDVTKDWGPIYDRSDLDGFYLAIGSSGNQFKNGPTAGKMMATLIAACENGHDHDADPVSFTLEHLGTPVSLGFASRNREINQNSSFSVIG